MFFRAGPRRYCKIFPHESNLWEMQWTKHAHLCNFLFNVRWPFFFICVTNLRCNTGKMSTFPHHFVFCELVKNAVRPWGQGLNPCLFLVKSDFSVGGVCGTLAFSPLRDFVYMDEDSAKSHQPTATKHTGLRWEGTGETQFLCFVWVWHFWYVSDFFSLDD